MKKGKIRLYNADANKNAGWGVLTGIRPVKLAGELYEKCLDKTLVKNALIDEYLLSAEKAELLIDIYEYQRRILQKPADGHAGVYIGIPFCPTRCLYCSFTSNQAPESKILEYMDALCKEIEFTGHEMKRAGMKPETVYIGGGTPTTLGTGQLEFLFAHIKNNFDLSELKEFTVEAGRPDTITPDKLRIIKEAGVTRISINPQSMREKTLELIGRSHTPQDIREAFFAARAGGPGTINMDVIAGLPEESTDDFLSTVEQVVQLGPENITVHTLAVKRASKLIDINKEYHHEKGETVTEMLQACYEMLRGAGYVPYYLYRQKRMTGNLENIGWCKEGTAGVYNIRIMEEKQTIIALGAGGITKVYFPRENRLERVPNVSNYEQYISRIDEMIERKRNGLFFRISEPD